MLVEGSDCASYLLFPGCDSDLHELFGTCHIYYLITLGLRYTSLETDYVRLNLCVCCADGALTVSSTKALPSQIFAHGLATAVQGKIRRPVQIALLPV